ncbi:hypothetical protein ACF0H5_020018 [Mactra antiquata]
MTTSYVVALLLFTCCLATSAYGQLTSGSQFAMMDWLMDDPHKANRMPFWSSLMSNNARPSSTSSKATSNPQPMTSGHFIPGYSYGGSFESSQPMMSGHFIPGYSSGSSSAYSQATSANFMGGMNFFPPSDDIAFGANGAINFDF